ncbi:hypothetical protein EII23_11625 [Desulfovibrio sp. OH1186_COT-070]|nr:hypothetical protein EII24_11625 [Desulfovibrio sp. OH1209_COT-279]RRD84240.1 hypothetical protein EII23_11625 [Desulfovibrio sp. OH1186_COT-070]
MRFPPKLKNREWKRSFPRRKTAKSSGECDKELYKARHLIEDAFLHLKRWRGIATRYAKNAAPFLADIQIRCIFLWASPRDYTI